MSEFFNQSKNFVKSIIAQRKMLLRFDKCKIANADEIRIVTEKLNNELEVCSGDRTIANFIYRNYYELKKIIPHSKGFEKRIQKLTDFYNRSWRILS